MITLTRMLAARGPTVTVIGGGGDHTRVEVAAHHKAGTPVILQRGTRRVTDELATNAQSGRTHVLDVHDHDRLRSGLMAILNLCQVASL
jgi:SLOG in TRPM, prokaryote